MQEAAQQPIQVQTQSQYNRFVNFIAKRINIEGNKPVRDRVESTTRGCQQSGQAKAAFFLFPLAANHKRV